MTIGNHDKTMIRKSSIVNRQSLLPARLSYSGDFSRQCQRTETEAAQLEFTVITTRTSAAQTPVMGPHLELRCLSGFGSHAISCHNNSRQFQNFRFQISDSRSALRLKSGIWNLESLSIAAPFWRRAFPKPAKAHRPRHPILLS